MQDKIKPSEVDLEDQKGTGKKELNLLESLVPVLILMSLLAYNIFLLKVKIGLVDTQISIFY
tara:strand:- start:2540 stop:2725 length:186 start_codon:yes stop_codon:yes gene_type:complete